MNSGPSSVLRLAAAVNAAVLLIFVSAWGAPSQAGDAMQPVEHAVIIHMNLSEDPGGSTREREAVVALEDALIAAVADANVGEVDGALYGEWECILYLYGPDADRLFGVVESVSEKHWIVRSGFIIKRFGEADDPAAREERVDLL